MMPSGVRRSAALWHQGLKYSSYRLGLALAWGADDPGRLSSAVDDLLETIMAEFKKMQSADIVEGLFEDADAAYFDHVGLPHDTTLEQFISHYTVPGGDVDLDRACGDLASFPPVAAVIAAGLEEARS